MQPKKKSQHRIVELAQRILDNVSQFDAYLQDKGLPPPSFDEDGPVDFDMQSREVTRAREGAIDASWELYHLLLGPDLCLQPMMNGSCLQAIYKYDIASKVPLHGEISFEDLADQCGIDATYLRRILRFEMIFHYVFCEPHEGFVAHTAASRKLAEDHLARDTLGFMFEEFYPAFAHTMKARETFMSEEQNKTGWCYAMGTEMDMFSYYETHPELGKRFAGAMTKFTVGPTTNPSLLVDGYPWSSISGGTGTVVDVGGGAGNISAAIAQAAPDLHFIVQDLPHAFKEAKSNLSGKAARQIEFMAYNFFEPQPYQADVYLFRNIFHDWSDANAIRILRATVPALRSGAKIVINDFLVPEFGTMSSFQERAVRRADMEMLTVLNAREREEREWLALFQKADRRFHDIKIWLPEGSSMAIIEAIWKQI